MDLLFNAIKGQANSLNLVIFTGVVALVLYRLDKRRMAAIFVVLGLCLFLLFSTNYLPGYLVSRLESRYEPFHFGVYPQKDARIYIHVLGGGYTIDPRLPSQGQLSLIGLGRLAEAIRVFNLYDSGTLVTSGNIASGDETLASVVRKAAISLGVDDARVEMLEGPATTQEEAGEFRRRFGLQTKVIVVTDAVHIRRAMRFFEQQGIEAYPAPANYLIKQDDNPFALRWAPSVENFLLMDRVLREFFGSLKGTLNTR